MILSPVGPYFKDGFQPIKLFADTANVRAWPGGVGSNKVGGNYAPSIEPSRMAAERHGCSQVLWLFGPDRQVTEVGSMNIFFVLRDANGKHVELVTPPLDRGDILPGVTRRSVLELTREWTNDTSHSEFTFDGLPVVVSERWITLDEIAAANSQGRLVEVFGCGTAALLCPVASIVSEDSEIIVPTPSASNHPSLMSLIWKSLSDIQVWYYDALGAFLT